MIEKRTATIWYSSKNNRRFLSKRAAIQAEARAIIEYKYPQSPPEYENGMLTYPGDNWTDIPRSQVMFRRLCRLIKRTLNEQA